MLGSLVLLVPVAIAAATVDSRGLVGHWKFDEGEGTTVRDSAGAHHGTLHGSRWTQGVAGGALRFDVSGAYAEVPAAADFDITGELTITAWLKTENFDTPILNKLQYYAPGNYDFRIERSGAISLSHQERDSRRSSRYLSSTTLSAGRWSHVAVTLRVGGEVRFYVDGVPAGLAKQAGALALVASEPLRIGAKPDPYSSFRGVLDEVRVYRRVLSAEEVKALADEFRPEQAPSVEPAAVALRPTLVSPEAAERVDTKAEWPQWLGPARDGRSTETGLPRRWPDGGPPLAWFVEGLGEGYSTVSIAGGRIYTTGMIGQQEIIFAMDLRGQPIWQRAYGKAWEGRYSETRTTPTVDDGRVHVTSGMGRVVCLDAASGAEIWGVDAAKEFDTNFDYWGIAESPLIIGDTVICTPCGKRATFAALNKKTGALVWASRSLDEETGYSSPICIPVEGRRVIVSMLKKSIVGVDAANGEILWRLMYADYQTRPHGINPNSPVYHNGSFYTSSGYECGGALHAISKAGDAVTRRWAETTLDCHHGGVVLVDGHLYGSNFKGHYAGNWVCLDWATGEVRYETKWLGKGSIAYADGMLYCYEEKEGTIGLVRPTPERFEVTSSFKVPKGTGPHWAHPVICGGRLYVRHGDALMAYDLRGAR